MTQESLRIIVSIVETFSNAERKIIVIFSSSAGNFLDLTASFIQGIRLPNFLVSKHYYPFFCETDGGAVTQVSL